MKKIVIIGGGAGGTLLAINLLKANPAEPLSVTLIEKRQEIGAGVAYSTLNDVHLLNVPAAKMGAFADNIEHFHTWLTLNNYAYEANSFVPRMIFSRYLRDCLKTTAEKCNDNLVFSVQTDEAVGIEKFDNSAKVHLSSGSVVEADKVVLAFGNFLPPHPNVPDLTFAESPKYIRDPWNNPVLDEIGNDDVVTIVGTGLSMVDITMQLERRGHRGTIIAISTRGMLPAVHKLGYTYPSFAEELEGKERITDILKIVRRHTDEAESNGSDWRTVIDSLRPVTQKIWLGLPLAEKKYFMQHLSRYWNTARHRMAPEAAHIIDELRGTGQLQVLKGRLKWIGLDENDRFDIRLSNIGIEQRLTSDHLINCIGSESRFDSIDSPLVQDLLSSGLIRSDDIRFGLDADPDGTLISANGEKSDLLYTLGTALKGILWESTAIPEIRVQARSLADKLIAEK